MNNPPDATKMSRLPAGSWPDAPYPPVSIVTVVKDDPRIEQALSSVAKQHYPGPIEHVVVDGGSGPETMNILARWSAHIDILISEPDGGIYDAMNKGISASSGEIVALLNADDHYASPTSIMDGVEPIQSGYDASYGDLVVATGGKQFRVWRAGRGLWRLGWMPPHPTVFLSAAVYENHGLFRRDMGIAADYELMLRTLGHRKATMKYAPGVRVIMSPGGASQRTSSLLSAWQQSARAWSVNGSRWGPIAATMKPLRKLRQLFEMDDLGHGIHADGPRTKPGAK